MTKQTPNDKTRRFSKPAIIRLLRRFIAGCLLLALVGLVWTGYYVRKQGVTKSWRRLVETEVAKSGCYVDIGKLKAESFQRWMAEDLRFYQSPLRKQQLGLVDSMIVDLDLSQLLNRDLSIKSMDLQDAKFALPLYSGMNHGERLVIDIASGRLVVTGNRIEVPAAKMKLNGIELIVRGTLDRPTREPNVSAHTVNKEELYGMHRLRALVREIESLEFPPGDSTQLELKFEGKMGDLKNLHTQYQFVDRGEEQ